MNLSTKVNKASEILPLKSLALEGISVEFDINQDLIHTQNWSHNWEQRVHPTTYITRIKINNANDFNFKYSPSQIIDFEIDQPKDFDMVKKEILSLDLVSRIEYRFKKQDNLKFVRIIESILTRPNLKQIDFHGFFDFDSNLDIWNEFPKNFTVHEITFRNRNFSFNFKIWKKVFDALPNIKRVRVVTFDNIENLPMILKNISNFKNLKSLHFAICSRYHNEKINVKKIQDCCNIIKGNFPMKAKVIIADMDLKNDLTNLIEKEEEKEPKIVIRKSWFPLVNSSNLILSRRYPVFGSSFMPSNQE